MIISIQLFVILLFLMVGLVAVLAWGFPSYFQALVILIISATIGFVIGRLVAPFLLQGFEPLWIDYFGFLMAGVTTLGSRAYLTKQYGKQVSYK